MIQAGGGAGFGHSTSGRGACGTDVQPLAPSINISPQAIVLYLRIAQPSIGGPLGSRIPFVDIGDGSMPLCQDLAGLPLAVSHLLCSGRALDRQLLAIAPALRRPCGCPNRKPAGQRRGSVPPPPDQRRPERHSRSSSRRRLYRPGTKTFAPFASVT